MEDKRELKPTSFRIDDFTREKLKQITSELGGNQQQALQKLIETYEFQHGKTILLEKKADIENFEKYISMVTRLFMNSLEDNQNITDKVRTEFESLLKSKDETIIMLQEEKDNYMKRAEQSLSEAKRANDDLALCTEKIKDLNEQLMNNKQIYENTLSNKDETNSAMKDAYYILKMEKDKIESEQSNYIKLKEENVSLQKTNSELQVSLDKIVIENERALLHQEKHYNKLMHDIEELHKDEIAKYQSKYLELLEKLDKNTSV